MYIGLLHLHNTLRWIILLAALITLLKYFIGWFSQKPWEKSDNILGAVFTGLMDLQFLTGIILYAFVSPVTQAAFQDFGAAMKNADLRFYAVEHSVMMLIAVVLVHIGRIKSKKAASSKSKFASSLLFFGIAYIIILAAIPWQRVVG
ncbi:hypothetical protein [Mangrovibacterium diazotrophicum]|uniref:Cytochrome b561-like protein n=1 Tax=Mangrovibacterium diazotrophicum TaxID=1261403 RepID=A0A419W730_9BACT|nr:hypothetical protein [Mangrovibacterium diazotrophicum]RKD91268.1 hypothetical protein BC643_1617 [Mangrovibacterium diazotrophicum]